MSWFEPWTNLIWREISVDVFILFEILYVLERVMAYNMEWAVMCCMGLVQFNFGLSISWKKLKFKIQFSCPKKKIASLCGPCWAHARNKPRKCHLVHGLRWAIFCFVMNQIITKGQPRHLLVIATSAEDIFCDVFLSYVALALSAMAQYLWRFLGLLVTKIECRKLVRS